MKVYKELMMLLTQSAGSLTFVRDEFMSLAPCPRARG